MPRSDCSVSPLHKDGDTRSVLPILVVGVSDISGFFMTELAWTQGRSKETFDEFLIRCPPSKTYAASQKDDGAKWIWVRSNRGQEEVESGSSQSIEDARTVLDDLVERYQEIEVGLWLL